MRCTNNHCLFILSPKPWNMKKYHLSYCAGIACVLLSLTACQKQGSFIPIDIGTVADIPIDVIKLPPPKAPLGTKIIKFRADGEVYSFYYNSAGNPDSITHPNAGTGYPNRQFRYDALGRLTDYIGPYENGWFEFWKRFYYDASGKIVRDTTYIFGEMGVNPTNYYLKRLNEYQYDAQGRISQVTETYLDYGWPPIVTNYSYDLNGNLVRTGVTYDKETNAHRIHPIWQFIARDYSVNNPFIASAYVYGLPAITYPGGVQYSFLDIYYDSEGLYKYLF